MSCSATSLATTEPCRKKRPHQWISISMPCVPLLPMLVLGTCPHLDSFYALVKKQTEPRTEPSKHHPVHFYQPECFAKNQPAKRHNLYSGPKLEIGPEKSHSKIWKMHENVVSFCSKDLQKKSPKSPKMPQRPYRQPALRIHDMTTQPLATTQGARMNDLKQPFLGNLGLFLSGELFVWPISYHVYHV